MHSLSFDFTVAEETLMLFIHRNFLRKEINNNKESRNRSLFKGKLIGESK